MNTHRLLSESLLRLTQYALHRARVRYRSDQNSALDTSRRQLRYKHCAATKETFFSQLSLNFPALPFRMRSETDPSGTCKPELDWIAPFWYDIQQDTIKADASSTHTLAHSLSTTSPQRKNFNRHSHPVHAL